MNLFTKYLEFSYVTGAFSLDSVRVQAKFLLRDPDFRRFWEYARSTYRADAGRRRERLFVSVVDEEYEIAAAGGGTPLATPLRSEPAAEPEPITAQTRQTPLTSAAVGLVAGAAVVAGAIAVRQLRRSNGVSRIRTPFAED